MRLWIDDVRRAQEDYVCGEVEAPQKAPKKRSRFSSKYPLAQYQAEIKGWLLNNKFCKNWDEIN